MTLSFIPPQLLTGMAPTLGPFHCNHSKPFMISISDIPLNDHNFLSFQLNLLGTLTPPSFNYIKSPVHWSWQNSQFLTLLSSSLLSFPRSNSILFHYNHSFSYTLHYPAPVSLCITSLENHNSGNPNIPQGDWTSGWRKIHHHMTNFRLNLWQLTSISPLMLPVNCCMIPYLLTF